MRLRGSILFGFCLCLAFMTLACGPSVRDTDDVMGECPAGETLCYDTMGNAECVPLADDPSNCGSCGRACDSTTSNSCFDGMCACLGANHEIADECDAPTVCSGAIGKCIFPDYGSAETCDQIEGIPCPPPPDGAPDWVCVLSWCTVPDCGDPETCDGKDNDCDGHLDATGDHPGQPVPLVQQCYEGDPATLDVGECKGGTQQCYFGSWTPQSGCPGQILPIPETGLLLCDGRDNDCNACVDDQWVDGTLMCGVQSPVDMDVVPIIDISGSMSDDIAASQATWVGLEPTYGMTPYIEWGLETVSANTPSLIQVVSPLTSFASFKPVLLNLSANGGGTEPSYDAVWLTLTGMLDAPLNITPADPWDLPIVIVMTDEQGSQTLLGLTEADVCAAVAAKGAILAVFTDPFYFTEWDDCAYVYPLTSVAATMTMQIDDLFEQVCAPMSMSMLKAWNWRRLEPLWRQRVLEVRSGQSLPDDGPMSIAP